MYFDFMKNIEDFKDRTLDKTNYLLEASIDRISPYSKKEIILKTTKLHSTLDSIIYSLTLLRYKAPHCISISTNIIKSILSLQEKSHDSQHFGSWLCDLETDINSYGYPSKDLAFQIGIPLLIQYMEFSDLFPPDLNLEIRDALIRACFSIIHRNIEFQNSHVVIAEFFLTSVCGQYFNIPELITHSKTKLLDLYYYTKSHGGFYLYNTPTHYKYILTILHFSKHYLKDYSYSFPLDELTDTTWRILSKHYNKSLSQIAGPSMHLYKEKSQEENLIKFLETACTNHARNDSIFSLNGLCPIKYRGYFTGSKKNFYTQELVFSGSTYPFYAYPQIATTLIKSEYDIGSFCRCQCWKENVPFLAHFGSKTETYTLTLKALYNGFEFTSAQLSTVQHFNYALGHITFATNRAKKHISYDCTRGIISPSDLRIRFEITGNISKLNISQSDINALRVSYKTVNLIFNYSYAVYNGKSVPVKLTHSDNSLCLDLVLYNGKAKQISLKNLNTTIFAWAFCISNTEIPALHTNNMINNEKLISTLITDDNTPLQLESLHIPDTFENIHCNNQHKISNIKFEEFVLANNTNNKLFSSVTADNNNLFHHIYDENTKTKDNITSLALHSENEFVSITKNIFSSLIKEDVTLKIAKHSAIQLLTVIYDYYTNFDLQFETIIKSQAPKTNLLISLSTDIEHVEFHTIETLKLLHMHYIKLSKATQSSTLHNKIITLINENFSVPDLSLNYISEKLDIPVSTISRIFKQVYNMKYIDYVTHLRISYAKQLLEQTNMPLSDISAKIGYSDQATFYRTFKKTTKETPAQFRKKLK